MNWRTKARIMALCAKLPAGPQLYRLLQSKLGRLDGDPTARLTIHAQMVAWLHAAGKDISGATVLEVGTGHKPIIPLAYYLCGATRIITLDLHRNLDWRATQHIVAWLNTNRPYLHTLYGDYVDTQALDERLAIMQHAASDAQTLLRATNIDYRAPSDATQTDLPDHTVDLSVSVTTLEHIPPPTLAALLAETARILAPDGAAIHYIDLSDHFHHQDAALLPINFLRYSEDEWHRLADNPFAYCNRLRASDYDTLFAHTNLPIMRRKSVTDDASLRALQQGFAIAQPFAEYDEQDLCTVTMTVMAQPATHHATGATPC